ncbi:helix-turn-helix domain-containing protein [Streptomyces varsoviensis]|uniref:helix-turn-helix domain-containing protein n=1 Tax=Streptomyces varsoviensis TaxID=67373 RepID=UPI0034034D75
MPEHPTAMASAATAAPAVSTISTRSVDPADRVELWEDYNRRALVGLTCSPYSEQGLLARQTNFRLGGLRLAEITGNEHVIERAAKTCRALPKDSVFASLLVSGRGVFFHGDGCLTPAEGDLVLYDTRRSYLFGFPCAMRQLLVDIPREVFTENCAAGGVPTPLLFGRRSAGEGPLVSALRSVLADFTARGGTGEPDATAATVLDLVRSLAASRLGDGAATAGRASRLAVAEDYIGRHLSDPALSAGRVAEAVGVSARQLSRIFEPSGVSPARRILELRLARAREQLADDGSRRLTVAEIAHRWGFASQAHFTRVFGDRFGHTPGAIRPGR